VATAVAVIAAAVWFVLLRPSGPNGPAVALALSFPKGRDVGYRVSVSMDGTFSVAGHSVDVSVSVGGRMKVHTVSTEQGVTTVRMSASHLTATANGKRVKSPDQRSVVRITRDGRVLGGGSFIPSPNDGPMNVLPGSGELTPLPDHAVRLGETWKNEFALPIPIGKGSADFSTSSSLRRYQVVGGVRSAVIESHATVGLDGIEMKLRDMMAGSTDAQQLPPGVDPSVSLSGSIQMFETTWLDPHHDLLLKQEGSGQFHAAMSVTGVPGGQNPGEFDFDGHVAMAMEKLG